MATLRADDLPATSPGVYALFRDGEPVYVGVAEKQSLRGRVWGSHRGRGVSMTGSALRRNMLEHLGIATASAVKKRLYRPTTSDAAAVVAWIDGCEIAWIACGSPAEALDLERRLKAEYLPPLTRR
jgi:hypothetical protein